MWGKKPANTFLQPNRLDKRYKNQARRKISLQQQVSRVWQRHTTSIQLSLFWLRKIVWIAIGLGCIATFTAWLLDPQTLPILELRVEGNKHTTLTQLQHSIAPFATGSFFQVDAAQVQQQVLRLPWVKTATVKKMWSDTLLITLVEYQAVARWDDNTFVDSTALLFVLPKEEQQNVQNLPTFTGKEDSVNDILVNYSHWQQLLQPTSLDIREIGCNARQAWYIILNNKTKLLLGRDEADSRIQRFIRFHARIKREPALIDLRYRGGIAVRAF